MSAASLYVLPPSNIFALNEHSTEGTTTHDATTPHYPSSLSSLPYSANTHLFDPAFFSQAVALLQQQPQPQHTTCMNDNDYYAGAEQRYDQRSDIRLHTPAPVALPYDSALTTPASSVSAHSQYGNWQMYQAAIPNSISSLKRSRSHQRTPSTSTVGSNGPSSPYTQHPNNYAAHPQIANTDFAPHEQPPSAFAEQASAFQKSLYTPSDNAAFDPMGAAVYMPSTAAHSGGAHDAMKNFAMDHHTNGEYADFAAHSARNSMSSRGSPSTPTSGGGEAPQNQNGHYALPQQTDVPQTNPSVNLWRSDSQAYQDELYNPPTTEYTAAPRSASKAAPANFLSPHRNLVTERLQTANLARSQSPTSSVSRERSPFRDGSMLAPQRWQQSPSGVSAPGMSTATGIRQAQKEQADEEELSRHRPQLNREPTKTISPKEVALDYNETEQPSLFQDSIPAGYKQHTGGTEQWPSNFYGQPGSAFGTLQTPSQQAYHNFRASATSADGFAGTDQMATFTPLPPQDASQVQNTSYLNTSYAASKMESNPEFPAHLTTMESSISDNGPPPSSQDSLANTSAPQRPADTRAATGTYTCTYHGCTQRFDSHANLQKHKRDVHRSQQPARDNSTAPATSEGSGSGSESPRSTESPGPSGGGMTSAAIMARNSQAGPHKCTRINPSTNKPCNTIFSRPYDLTRHEDTIHNNRKQKVRCPMCREEKTFSRNDALTRHMRVVHPEVESFGKRGKSRGV